LKARKTWKPLSKKLLASVWEGGTKSEWKTATIAFCAAHDLAPIFESAFDIKPRELALNKEFFATLDRFGRKLKDDDKWTGLRKKSFLEEEERK
jgi:hypothetical protein